MIREKSTREGVVVLKTKITRIGNAKPATMELKETYLETISVMANTPIQISVGSGLMARTKAKQGGNTFASPKPT